MSEPKISDDDLALLAATFFGVDHGVMGMLTALYKARQKGRERDLIQSILEFARYDMKFRGGWVTRDELNDLIRENIDRATNNEF